MQRNSVELLNISKEEQTGEVWFLVGCIEVWSATHMAV